MYRVFFCVVVAALAGFASADGSHVASLTEDNFADKIADGKVYFIKFFAPWCGHCKRLAPTWADLAEYYKGSDEVAVAHVDCTAHKNVCSNAEVRGYPTLKVYHGGEAKEQYKGSRELSALKIFIEDQKRALLEETTS